MTKPVRCTHLGPATVCRFIVVYSRSNTSIPVSSYTLTSGETKTFYYNLDLKIGDTIDGDFCEWNDYEQIERVV